MAELDEMEQAIKQRSQVYGFKLAVIVLALWTIYGLLMHFGQGADYNPLPSLVLCAILVYQIAWESYLKHHMVDGDDEFHEPNTLIRIVFASIAIAIVVLGAGIVLASGIS